MTIHFATPYAFLLIPFLPFAVGGALQERILQSIATGYRRLFREAQSAGKTERSQSALRFASTVDLASLPLSGRARLREVLLTPLHISAFLLLVIALARPQIGTTFADQEFSGRDIMLALDVSGSMRAMDFFIEGERVDRLSALKHVVGKFIDGRTGDRLGLVVFGGEVFTQCPLTLDHSVVHEYLDLLETGMGGEGTAIGDGLAVTLKRIRDIPGDTKAIVLVTDGKSNWGKVSPDQAAEVAKILKIKVHTIGIGSDGPAPMPVQGMFGETYLRNVPMEYDEKTLKSIAEKTGGSFFNARDTEQLEEIYSAIDKLEERKDKVKQITHYDEYFYPFVLFGLLLLLTHELLASTVFAKVP